MANDTTNDISSTLAALRNKLQEATNDLLNKQHKNIETNSKAITRSNSILDELSQTIQNNVDTLKKYGMTDKDTPVFMRNHIAEKIQEEKINPSLITSRVQELETTKPLTAQKEKDGSETEVKKDVKLLDKKKVRELAASLKARVFGQDTVIDEVIDFLNVSALRLQINKGKPAGCYLFAGPSGVGKTELAQSISDQLGVPLLKINMGEYGLEQDVTKLIGTSKGYIGYNEGGLLTNFVSENPACVILFDELEKAHFSIDKILLSIMDHGTCTDNNGKEVYFKETIIISTSNLGAEIEYETDLDKDTKDMLRMDCIKEGLRPEIINRYDSTFHFSSLSPEIYKLVTNKFLSKLNDNMLEEHGFNMKFTPKLIDFIVEKSFDPAMGGRPARRFIEKIVIKPLAEYMLLDEFEDIAKTNKEITMDLNKKNQIYFKSNRKILGVLENTAELVTRIENSKFTNKSRNKP
jgi:ATP-dependent Clp protease ATP-binding subunit ClpA